MKKNAARFKKEDEGYTNKIQAKNNYENFLFTMQNFVNNPPENLKAHDRETL